MKTNINIIKYLPALFAFALVACNSTGNNANMDKPGIYTTSNSKQLLKSNNLKSISKPLVITMQAQSNSLGSLITVTNPNNNMQLITSNPIITNSAFILDNNMNNYPSSATICKQDLQLDANSSCMMLVNTTNTNTTNQTGTLRLITPTYTYILGLSKAQIIYAAGNFSQVSLSGANFNESKIQSSNSGVCGADGKGSCMIVAYDTLNKTLKEIAETSGEVYALAVTPDNSLIAGGAFAGIVTPAMTTSLALPTDLRNRRLASTLIAQINPTTNIATAFANTNQAVYSFSVSPVVDSGTSLGNIYISGAFSTIYEGLTDNALIKPQFNNGVEQCLTASKSINNSWSMASNGNGYTTSLATAKSKSAQLDSLLIAGKASIQNGTILSNYKVGVTSCVGKDCNAYAPLVLDATPNVIAATPDNKMLISGEFNNIAGVGKYTHNDVLASGTIQTIGQFSKVSSGDGKVHALLATNNDYFMGGNFSEMNGGKVYGSGKCGLNGNNLCVLADYDTLNFNTANLIYTDDDINALASGIELQVTLPQ